MVHFSSIQMRRSRVAAPVTGRPVGAHGTAMPASTVREAFANRPRHPSGALRLRPHFVCIGNERSGTHCATHFCEVTRACEIRRLSESSQNRLSKVMKPKTGALTRL
jgi:hypothetical protein